MVINTLFIVFFVYEDLTDKNFSAMYEVEALQNNVIRPCFYTIGGEQNGTDDQ
jgi:hypothetical protein